MSFSSRGDFIGTFELELVRKLGSSIFVPCKVTLVEWLGSGRVRIVLSGCNTHGFVELELKDEAEEVSVRGIT